MNANISFSSSANNTFCWRSEALHVTWLDSLSTWDNLIEWNSKDEDKTWLGVVICLFFCQTFFFPPDISPPCRSIWVIRSCFHSIQSYSASCFDVPVLFVRHLSFFFCSVYFYLFPPFNAFPFLCLPRWFYSTHNISTRVSFRVSFEILSFIFIYSFFGTIISWFYYFLISTYSHLRIFWTMLPSSFNR